MTSTIFGRPVVHVSHQKFKELYSKEELGVWVDYSGATKIAQSGLVHPKLSVLLFWMIPLSLIGIIAASLAISWWLLLLFPPIAIILFKQARTQIVNAVIDKMVLDENFYKEASQLNITKAYALTDRAYSEYMKELRQFIAEDRAQARHKAQYLFEEESDEDVTEEDVETEDEELKEYRENVEEEIRQTVWASSYSNAMSEKVPATLLASLIEQCFQAELKVRTCRNMIIQSFEIGNGDEAKTIQQIREQFVSLSYESENLDFYFQFTKDETDYHKYFEQGIAIAEAITSKLNLTGTKAKVAPIFLTYLATCCSTPELNWVTFASNTADRLDAVTGESFDRHGYVYSKDGEPIGFASKSSPKTNSLCKLFRIGEGEAFIRAHAITAVHRKDMPEFNDDFSKLIQFAKDNIGWRAVNASKA